MPQFTCLTPLWQQIAMLPKGDATSAVILGVTPGVRVDISMLNSMLLNQDLCHGFWLAESEAVSQSDAMISVPIRFWPI